jgi:hypothetical protein
MGAVIKMVLESAIHLSREAGICRGQPGRAGKRLIAPNAPLALWMGAVIEMVLETAFHWSREAGICCGQLGHAGERHPRSQCAAGALDWGRKKKALCAYG